MSCHKFKVQQRVTGERVIQRHRTKQKYQQDDTVIVSKEKKILTASKRKFRECNGILKEVLKSGKISSLLSENKFNIPKQRARERGILKTLDLTTISEIWISLKH